MPSYDIIGDIHGQADKLIQLLDDLGYMSMKSTTIPTSHTAASSVIVSASSTPVGTKAGLML